MVCLINSSESSEYPYGKKSPLERLPEWQFKEHSGHYPQQNKLLPTENYF